MLRDRVDDLLGRHDDVDHLEVLLQAVADEATAGVDQLAQLQVGRLHRGDVVARDRRVEVARVQPRVARQVVDHRLGLCSVHAMCTGAHAVRMLCACGAHAVCMRCACCVHAVRMRWCACKAYAVVHAKRVQCMQGACRVHVHACCT